MQCVRIDVANLALTADDACVVASDPLASRLLPEGSFSFDVQAGMQAFYQELYGLDQTAFETEVLPLLNGDYAP